MKRMTHIALIFASAWFNAVAASAAEPVDYLRDVKPVLKANCFACHGALKQEAGLRLDAAALIRKGGESGPAIVAGESGERLLIDAITGEADFERMPEDGKPLAPEKTELLKPWIHQGAKAPDEP